MRCLIVRGRRRNKKHLVDVALKLFKTERTVVQRGGQAEPIIHQRIFTGSVPRKHPAYLWDRHVRFVYYDKEVVFEIIQQRKGRFALRHAVQMPRIILYPGAKSRLSQHFHVKVRPLRNALRLQKHVLTFKIFHTFIKLPLNHLAGGIYLLLRHDIVGRRENHHMLHNRMYLSRQRVCLRNPVDLIPKKLHADQIIPALCRTDLHHVAPDAETAAPKIHVVSVVLHLNQPADHLVPVLRHAGSQGHAHARILLRTSQPVNAGDTGDHHHIPPLSQRCRRG